MDDLHWYLAGIFLTKGFKSAIDIGCAHGVLTSQLNYLCPTTGLDISKGYIKTAKKLYPKCKFIVADIMKHKPRHKYDVGVTCGLLIHIPEERIREVIKKILGFCKCAIFTESSAKPKARKGEVKYNPKKYWDYRSKFPGKDLKMNYYFNHNYIELFKELGVHYQVVTTLDEKTATKVYFAWK